MSTSPSRLSSVLRCALLRSVVGFLMIGAVSASATAASAKPSARTPAPKASADSASGSRVSDHEERRAKFQQLCANPTPSQRETLQIWAQLQDGKTYGPQFCKDVEKKYFGTKEWPKTWDDLGLDGVDNIRDYTPMQYFTKVVHLGVGTAPADLSPFANFTQLETFTLSDAKGVVDISVVANFKNLKTLSLANTQVVSLAPLAGLSKLETLDLNMATQDGLPGRKGFEALRNLTSLTDLSMHVAEPLGDQLKDLHNLESLVIYGPVKDVCSVRNLRKLSSLYLVKGGIRDISCLKDLQQLEIINIRGNPITSIAALAPLPKLRNLNIKNTLIEDLSPLTGNPNAYVYETDGAPLRWCSPKNARDIKEGVSCFNTDGTEKPWWKKVLRQ